MSLSDKNQSSFIHSADLSARPCTANALQCIPRFLHFSQHLVVRSLSLPPLGDSHAERLSVGSVGGRGMNFESRAATAAANIDSTSEIVRRCTPWRLVCALYLTTYSALSYKLYILGSASGLSVL